ncbi:MAG: biotin--[acetyl-CoA-carboxylase] ligase [Thermofilum sp.]|nr:biotin--[acetyl-CoA-carboxylase] ligase [Thermofilum sp.]
MGPGVGLEDRLLAALLLGGGRAPLKRLSEELGVPESDLLGAAMSLAARGYPLRVERELLELRPADDLSVAGACAARLGTSLRFSVVYLERCGSTQDAARELAERGVAEGAVVVAEVQEAGRGRLGRSWHSAAGGIYATVVLRPPPRALRALSLAASVAVARVLGLLGLDAKVKWPNDVQVSGRKVCGVLVEAAAEPGGAAYALVGIGLNVNNELPPELAGAAATLRGLLGRPVPRLPLFLKLLEELGDVYARVREGRWSEVLREWRGRSSTLGRVVRVETPEGAFTGLAVDVSEDGALLVRLESGELREFHAGDIVHLR